jgi:alcohol dehydrogenase
VKAFIVDHYGRKAGLRLGDMPRPELKDDEVLVQVHAAGSSSKSDKPDT